MAKTSTKTSAKKKTVDADVTDPPAAAPAREPLRGPAVHQRPTRQAPPPPAANDDFQEYPRTMYRKTKPSVKFPNGYEAVQAVDEDHEAKLAKAGWVDSHEGMAPEFPHGYEQ